MNYGEFAYIYDELMKDVPYHLWIEWVKKKSSRFQHPIKIMDLACGTGELSVRLSRLGYEVTGVDLSADMLTVAKAKADEENANIAFFQQNMTELEGFPPFDMIICCCDSLNYLSTEQEVKQTFFKVFQHLKNGGMFLFDVHSIFKISQIFMNQTFVSNEEEISYIWNCFPGEESNSVIHDLTFFVKDDRKHCYHRFDELHVQRTFSIQQYSQWLEEAGFMIEEITADFQSLPPVDTSERIFFSAMKK
jgi:2-polyprenyl-3-methyl-5-hydroxy-6-metoxy-1,4-benzoquinol methylase